MALGDDPAIGVEDRHFIGAVPSTVLAPDTARIIVPDDTVVEFDVGVGRAPFETLRIDTVVTAHRVEDLECIGETSRLHLPDSTPFDAIGVAVLFIARHFTAVTPYTRSSVEVKTVLLSRFELRDVDGVVTTLHTRIVLVVDEAL